MHVGHKNLLTRASLEGDEVLIGLTTDEKARANRESEVLNSYEIRKENYRRDRNRKTFHKRYIKSSFSQQKGRNNRQRIKITHYLAQKWNLRRPRLRSGW